MKKSKPEHRREYWKFHVAAHSFEMAQDVSQQLQQMKDNDSLFYPLMIALHVLYGRPFRHSKKSRNIDLSFITSDLLSVHDMLLNMRDRIFAHHDKESKITDTYTDVDMFQLVVLVNGGEMRPGIQLVFPTELQVSKVQDLCGHLYRACMQKAHESLLKCIGEVPSDGIYRVSTEFEGRAALLIRSELSTEQSRGHLKETIRRVPKPEV